MTELIQALTGVSAQIAVHLNAQLDTGKVDIPMLPEIANKVLSLTSDQDSNAQQLAALIQSDQALAGRVMQIANSAAYCPNASIVSLQQAISRLGMTMLAEIALAASINTKMFNVPGYENRLADIWKHALATALWGKEIARASRRNVEAAFLCGLLHSMGRPVILQNTLDLLKGMPESLNEREILDIEDALQHRASLVVAESWKMPKIIHETLLHYPTYATADTAKEQAMIVFAAVKFATSMLSPERLSIDDLKVHPVLADLNLYDDEIETLLEKTDAIKSTMESMRG